MTDLGPNAPPLLQKRCSPARRLPVVSRKVLIAVAALPWFATVAQAQPPSMGPRITNYEDFQIDTTRSYLSRTGSGFQPTDPAGHSVGPLLLSTPQNAALNNGSHIHSGSLYAPLEGRVYFNAVPGVSIQFLSGTQLGQVNPDPAPGSNVAGPLNMQVRTTGPYQPGRDNVGTLPQTSPGPQPGNFGVILTAVAATMRDTEWAFDSPLSLDPSFNIPSALAMDAAGTFNEHGLTLLLNKGTEDTVSGIGPPNEKNVGSTTPIPVDYNNGPTGVGGFQPAGTVMGNLDPVTYHLVLPINIVTYTEVRINGTLLGYTVSAINGQIIADALVPEPSTMTLLALGVVSLLGYAWRRRGAMKPG
jgi:hypothetical protein